MAIVSVTLPDTIDKVRRKAVPKGDVLEFARTSALFAVKKTSDTIPCCHPVPVESAIIGFELREKEICIKA